jgi:hypothetical protein
MPDLTGQADTIAAKIAETLRGVRRERERLARVVGRVKTIAKRYRTKVPERTLL